MKRINSYVKSLLGDELPDSIAEQLAVERDQLDTAFAENPSRFAFWAIQAEKARSAEENAKIDSEGTAARLDREVRDELEQQGIKVTEKLVDAEIKKHEEMQEAKIAYAEAVEKRRILDVVATAFKMRGDMLVSLGAHVRAEMDTDLRIKARETAKKS